MVRTNNYGTIKAKTEALTSVCTQWLPTKRAFMTLVRNKINDGFELFQKDFCLMLSDNAKRYRTTTCTIRGIGNNWIHI